MCFGVQLSQSPNGANHRDENSAFQAYGNFSELIGGVQKKHGADALASTPEGELYRIAGGLDINSGHLSSWAKEATHRAVRNSPIAANFHAALREISTMSDHEEVDGWVPSSMYFNATPTALVSFERVAGFVQALSTALEKHEINFDQISFRHTYCSIGWWQASGELKDGYAWDPHIVLRIEAGPEKFLPESLVAWLFVASSAWLCQDAIVIRARYAHESGCLCWAIDDELEAYDKTREHVRAVHPEDQFSAHHWRTHPVNINPDVALKIPPDTFPDHRITCRANLANSRSRLKGLMENYWKLCLAQGGVTIELEVNDNHIILSFSCWPNCEWSLLENGLINVLAAEAHENIRAAEYQDRNFFVPMLVQVKEDKLDGEGVRISPTDTRTIRCLVTAVNNRPLTPDETETPGCHCGACLTMPVAAPGCTPFNPPVIVTAVTEEPEESHFVHIEPNCGCAKKGGPLCYPYYLPTAPVILRSKDDAIIEPSQQKVTEWTKRWWLQ